MKGFVIAVMILVSMALSAAAEETSEPAVSETEAKAWLTEKGYELTAEAFVGMALEGNTEAVTMFVAAGLSPDAWDENRKMTPLLAATMYSKFETALEIVKLGANPNISDQNGATAATWAAQKCESTELLRALIEAGAILEASAAGGANPLMMAKVFQCEDNIALLEEAQAGN